MKDFPTQTEYLKKQGVTKDSPPEQLALVKKEHRHLYQQAYRKLKRKEEKRLTVRLSPDAYRRLVEYKKKHQFSSLSQFIVTFSLAYLDKEYLTPNPKEQRKVIQSIQLMSTNIHQIVSRLHQQLRYKTMHGNWDDSIKNMAKIVVGYELVLEQIERLHHDLNAYMSTPPPKFVGLSWEDIRHDPVRIKEIIRVLLERLEKLSSS